MYTDIYTCIYVFILTFTFMIRKSRVKYIRITNFHRQSTNEYFDFTDHVNQSTSRLSNFIYLKYIITLRKGHF